MDTEALIKQARENLLFVTNRPPIVMERGEGAYLWDTTGKRYLDFIGGWAVTALGHCPPCVRNAMAEQGQILINASPSFYNRPQIELARLLVEHSCLDKVWFGNSGAEVNEAAVKLARKYGQRHKNGAYEIITTLHSFHGRTLSMMAASGKEKFKSLFEPKTPGFVHVPLNDSQALKTAITTKTIAVMLEPIQGESGVQIATQPYLREVRRLCDEHGLLLIMDEVQTGMCRTGTLFCYEQYGIEPDLMTLAKGLGAGYPVAALLAKDRCCVFDAGDHGGTFGGQPLAMAVGLVVLKEMLSSDLRAHVQTMGAYLQKELERMALTYRLSQIRGKGLLVALDLPGNMGEALVTDCLDHGLIINAPHSNVIRFMPPLIITQTHVDEMIRLFTASLKKIIG